MKNITKEADNWAKKCLFLTLVSLNKKKPRFNCIQHMWKNKKCWEKKK